jgi:hypothetical protein
MVPLVGIAPRHVCLDGRGVALQPAVVGGGAQEADLEPWRTSRCCQAALRGGSAKRVAPAYARA